MKFANLLVYGIEGIPISKTEAAKRAGYSDAANEGSKMTNPNKYPLVCAYISNLRAVSYTHLTLPTTPYV